MSADRLLTELGRRVRELRVRHAWTLKDLAGRSGLSVRFLVDVESGQGNISVRNLIALADALGTTAAALLTGLAVEPHLPLVALLGVRGAGKTAVGRRLARRLHVPFVELDRRIEEAAGLSLAEIFAVHGEAYYRRLESEALVSLLAEDHPVVLATGGGIVAAPENYALLRRRCLTVWLRASPEEHWNRVIQQGDRRPMRDNPEAMAELRRLLAAREPLYAAADHTIETTGRSLDAVVEATLEAVLPHVGHASESPEDRLQA